MSEMDQKRFKLFSTSEEPGTYAFGGYIPHESEENPWPPKRGAGFRFFDLIKRFEALIRSGKLVWLRDYDECQTLAVAVIDKRTSQRYAYRIWPCYRRIVLNDDGTIGTDDRQPKYVRHWIEVDQTRKVFMLMQNSEIYAEPLE